ncbi:MAG: hypothetical protein PHH58_11485 [Rhodoferax sp.]|nr:hypothetical protein [Rhodoferax sp.]
MPHANSNTGRWVSGQYLRVEIQTPVMRAVAWANRADLAPECLLDLLQAQRQQQAA